MKYIFILAALIFTGFTAKADTPLYGEVKTLVVLVNFSDNPVQNATVSFVQDLVFNKVNAIYRESSYQRTWLSGDVYGPFTIPVLSSSCDRQIIAAESNAKAVASGAILSNYTRFVYMFPSNSGCGWSGVTGTGPNGERQVFTNNNYDVRVVAHELGHTFGLLHSMGLNCDLVSSVNCVLADYTDPACPMGGGVGQFNAFQKEQLGWLNAPGMPTSQIITANGLYNLEALETTATGVKALKILKSINPTTGSKKYYYLEYRQPIGVDANIVSNGNLTRGIQVRTGEVQLPYWPDGVFLDMKPTTSTSPFDLRDGALEVGSSFVDENGVSFALISADANGATVDVRIGNVSHPPPPPPAVDVTAPSVSIVSPVQGTSISASSTLIISANASDNIAVTKVEFRVNGSLKCTDSVAPYSCSYSVPKGGGKSYNIEAKAYDAANNSSSHAISVSTASSGGGGKPNRR